MPISLRHRTVVTGNAAQVVVQQGRPCGTGDAGALSRGGEQYRKRCGFAPEKSSKASSDLRGKHATFVASLTALAADTRHSIIMERSWVMACPSRGDGVFCRRDAALARPWAHRLLPPGRTGSFLGCLQASRAPRTQATTRRLITSHRHAAHSVSNPNVPTGAHSAAG